MSLNFIIKRGSLPWNRISWERFERVTFLTQKQLKVARQWNNQFGVSYLQFRAELKNIAGDCLRAVKDAHIVNYSYIDLIAKLPRQATIIQMDDDDLLSPTVFEELQERRTRQTLLFLWDAGKWDWIDGYFEIKKKTTVMCVNAALAGLRESSLYDYIGKVAARNRGPLGSSARYGPQYFAGGYEAFLDLGGVDRIREMIEGSRSLTRASNGLSLAIKSPASAMKLGKFDLERCSEFIGPVSERIPVALRWCGEYVERCVDLAKRTFG